MSFRRCLLDKFDATTVAAGKSARWGFSTPSLTIHNYLNWMTMMCFSLSRFVLNAVALDTYIHDAHLTHILAQHLPRHDLESLVSTDISRPKQDIPTARPCVDFNRSYSSKPSHPVPKQWCRKWVSRRRSPYQSRKSSRQWGSACRSRCIWDLAVVIGTPRWAAWAWNARSGNYGGSVALGQSGLEGWTTALCCHLLERFLRKQWSSHATMGRERRSCAVLLEISGAKLLQLIYIKVSSRVIIHVCDIAHWLPVGSAVDVVLLAWCVTPCDSLSPQTWTSLWRFCWQPADACPPDLLAGDLFPFEPFGVSITPWNNWIMAFSQATSIKILTVLVSSLKRRCWSR